MLLLSASARGAGFGSLSFVFEAYQCFRTDAPPPRCSPRHLVASPGSRRRLPIFVAYVDEVELGRATVRVTTPGQEFLRGSEGECVVADFPMVGEAVTLEWQQNSQNFVITDVK